MNTTIKAWFLDSPLPRANCKRLEAKRVKRLPTSELGVFAGRGKNPQD